MISIVYRQNLHNDQSDSQITRAKAYSIRNGTHLIYKKRDLPSGHQAY
jgi:hypothetical protein